MAATQLQNRPDSSPRGRAAFPPQRAPAEPKPARQHVASAAAALLGCDPRMTRGPLHLVEAVNEDRQGAAFEVRAVVAGHGGVGGLLGGEAHSAVALGRKRKEQRQHNQVSATDE